MLGPATGKCAACTAVVRWTPGLAHHTRLPLPCSLALSLHAPTQELRQVIVPSAKAFKLDRWGAVFVWRRGGGGGGAGGGGGGGGGGLAHLQQPVASVSLQPLHASLAGPPFPRQTTCTRPHTHQGKLAASFPPGAG
jgi:hypothetical protein